MCEPFNSPSMFSLAKEKKVAGVRRPTSLDLNEENYSDSVTLFKCWRLKTWQTKKLFAFRQQKRPILTGRGCVSHRTKEMTWHHVPQLIWRCALYLSGDVLARLCKSFFGWSISPLLWWSHFRAKQLILFGRSHSKSNMPELKESQRYKGCLLNPVFNLEFS